MSISRAQHPLATPNVSDIQNVGKDRLQLALSAVANARMYEVQSKVGTGGWVSAGASDRNNPVSHMSP